MKTPYEQVGLCISAIAFIKNGYPACKRLYWACAYEFSTIDTMRAKALEKLELSTLGQKELTEALRQVKLRGEKWSWLAVAAVLYGLNKRALAAQKINNNSSNE